MPRENPFARIQQASAQVREEERRSEPEVEPPLEPGFVSARTSGRHRSIWFDLVDEVKRRTARKGQAQQVMEALLEEVEASPELRAAVARRVLTRTRR